MGVFGGYGICVELPGKPGMDGPERYSDAFHVIKETLTRIGVASQKTKCLFQSCHLLHKKGQYGILHFKELFLLDGKPSTITEDDIARRNTIATMLEEWDLLKVLEKEKAARYRAPSHTVRIISFADKANWTLCPKYTIGHK